MNTSERIDVIAVLTPEPHQVCDPKSWHFLLWTFKNKRGTYTKHPIYEATIRCVDEPKATALIDAYRLDKARAAVAELVEADKRIDFTPLHHLPDSATCVITVTAGDLRRRIAALARISGGNPNA